MDWNLIPSSADTGSILAMNETTAAYGLTLTAGEVRELTLTRQQALRATGRIEFGGGTVERLMAAFCDSPYIDPPRWSATLGELLELFYAAKTRTRDRVGDAELMETMRQAFDGPCGGSLEALAMYLDRKEGL